MKRPKFKIRKVKWGDTINQRLKPNSPLETFCFPRKAFTEMNILVGLMLSMTLHWLSLSDQVLHLIPYLNSILTRKGSHLNSMVLSLLGWSEVNFQILISKCTENCSQSLIWWRNWWKFSIYFNFKNMSYKVCKYDTGNSLDFPYFFSNRNLPFIYFC